MNTRTTARLVILGPDESLLMMRIQAEDGDAASESIWTTLGGGVERGESILGAAERELFEETGIVGAKVGPILWFGEQIIRRQGADVWVKEHFVLVRTQSVSLSTQGWSAAERTAIAELKWWNFGELRGSKQTIKPPGYLRLVEPLLHDCAPLEPPIQIKLSDC